MGVEGGVLQHILDHQPTAVYYVDTEVKISYWNAAAEALTGIRADAVVGKPCQNEALQFVRATGEALDPDTCPISATLREGEGRTEEVLLTQAEAEGLPLLLKTNAVRDSAGAISGVVATLIDNRAYAEAQKQMRELEGQALLCPLTMIGNRRYAQQILAERFEEFKRHGSTFGVLFFTIDNFEQVNSRYGTAVGDVVLKMVANTLRHNLRTYDFVARWSGQEFVVIMPKVTGPQVVGTAERLRVFVQNTGRTITQGKAVVTVSGGVAVSGAVDEVLDDLLIRAQEELAISLSKGRNRISFASGPSRRQLPA